MLELGKFKNTSYIACQDFSLNLADVPSDFFTFLAVSSNTCHIYIVYLILQLLLQLLRKNTFWSQFLCKHTFFPVTVHSILFRCISLKWWSDLVNVWYRKYLPSIHIDCLSFTPDFPSDNFHHSLLYSYPFRKSRPKMCLSFLFAWIDIKNH